MAFSPEWNYRSRRRRRRCRFLFLLFPLFLKKDG